MEDIKYTDADLLDHDAVAAVVKNVAGQILMQDHVKFGFWTIIIGKAKPGQTPVEGIKEEILEECGIVAKNCKEIAVKDYPYVRKGKMVNVKLHLFEVTEYSGKLENKEPHKHRRQEFVDLDSVKKMPFLSDATILYLETLGFKREAKI